MRTLLLAILVALSVRGLVFEPFSIPSGSMIPTLEVGDFLFVSKSSYGYSARSVVWGLLPMPGRFWFTAPERGDIVVFKYPQDNRTDYIKRIIGLPGDTVKVQNGRLFINDVLVPRAEPAGITMDLRHAGERDARLKPAIAYTETLPEGRQHRIVEEGDDFQLDNTPPYRVPDGYYFVMGDNRDNSQDSRVQRMVGFVPVENLVGRAEFIFFSLAPTAQFWELWKWPSAIRWQRIGMDLRRQ